MHLRSSLTAGAAALLLAVLGNVSATPITFMATGDNGTNPVSASATFSTPSAGTLKVSVRNTYAGEIHLGGIDILTGLLFTTGSTDLSPVSAGLGGGSSLVLTNPGDSTDLDANWGYVPTGAHVGSGPSIGASHAVTASGLITGIGIFDMNGADQQAAGNFLHGADYGLIGNALDYTNGNGLIPLVANTIDFTFSYSGSLGPITQVCFVYGTAVGEGVYSAPTPPCPDAASTLGLLCTSVLALVTLARRRRT